jgi:hypothetical protein
MGFVRIPTEGGSPAPIEGRKFFRTQHKGRSMTKACLIQLALIMTLSSAASAQSPASRQEQIDCRPDAMKLCASHIGKPDDMRVCLAQNKAKLSDACRKVVEARGG